MADETNMGSSITPEENTYDQTISSTPDTQESPQPEGFSGFYGFGDIQANDTVFGQRALNLNEYVLNATDPNSYYNAAVNQGVLDSLGNGAMQAIFGEVLGGTISGIGALGNMLINGEYSERNFMERVGDHMMTSMQDEYEIFERNRGATFQFGDAAWWAKNLPSMASTLSMMVPGMAVGKVGKTLGKVGRATARKVGAKAGSKAGDVVEAGLENLTGGMAMRHAENMREAHDTYESAREEFLGTMKPIAEYKGTDAWRSFVRDNNRPPMNKYELADYMGGVAAKKTYQFNSANLFFDVLQMSALNKALRGTRGKMTGAKATAAGEMRAATKLEKLQSGMGRFAQFGIVDAGSEGVEELINYMGSEEGQYYARLMAGNTEQSEFMDRYAKYSADDHFWESGFLGMIGGAVFTGLGSGVGKAREAYRARTSGQKSLEDKVTARGKAIQDAADLAAAGAKAQTKEERRAVDMAVEGQLFGIGAQAAMDGTADVAENQVQLALMEMEAEGVPVEEQNERIEKMRQAMKAGEEAVAQTRREARALGLSGDEAAVYTQMAMDMHNRKHQLQTVLDTVTPMIEGIDNVAEQKAELDRRMLKQLQERNAQLREEGKEVPAQNELMEKALEKRVGENALPTTEAVEALRKEKAELQAKKDERTEEESARLQEVVTQLSDMEDASNMQIDDLVEDAHNLEFQIETAEGMTRHLQSNKGRELVKEVAEKTAAKRKVTEDKSFQKHLKEASVEELKADLRKEENPERKAAIQERIDQMELEAQNAAKSEKKEQTRSKDIVVPGVVQAKVDELLRNSDRLALNEDGTYYVDAQTGQKYQRATTFMNGGEASNIPAMWGVPSSNIGNSIDEFVRDFFDGAVRDAAAYPHLPAELQASLREELRNIEQAFVANGEKVIAKDVVLFGKTETNDADAVGVAGTVDLLTVDAEGNFRIYDMKTIRNAVAGNKAKDGKYGPKGRDLQKKHQKQLSTYKLLLENQVGAPVVDLGIIPIDVMYTPTKSMTTEQLEDITTERADLLPIIRHEALESVETLESVEEPQVEMPEEAAEAVVEEPQVPEETDDVAPVTDVTLDADEFQLPLTELVSYFAGRLQVTSEPGRGLPYLVHGHEGVLQIGDRGAAQQYDLLMRALAGDTTLPITLEWNEAVGTQTVQSVNVWSRLSDNPAADLLEQTDNKGNYTYRPGKGDSMQIVMKIGGVPVGVLPTTGELIQAAHDRGQANLSEKYSKRTFGTDSRVGAVRTGENLVMSAVTQEAHLANAVTMHALRQKLYEMRKNGQPVNVQVTMNTKENSFGQKAKGSLIYDTSGTVTAEQVGADAGIREHGVALQLPSATNGKMQLEVMGTDARVVTPYQQGEERSGQVDANAIERWNSGALFVPLVHQGEVLWVKAPGQTISQLNSGEELVDAIVKDLNSGNDEFIANLQNVLGSNALRRTEQGDWALYPTNQNKRLGDEPVSVLRNGKWSVDVAGLVPGMAFDVAAKIEGADSAFQDANNNIEIGTLKYDNLADFVAREIKLGYTPVIHDGEVMGWTHPLAPAYPFNDGKAGKKFSNENTANTQLTVTVAPVGVVEGPKKVSGKAALDAILGSAKDAKTDEWVADSENSNDWDGLGWEGPTWFFATAAAESARNTSKASKEDMDIAEKWWAENMSHVPFKRVKGIISRGGRTAYGIFEAGAVQVSDVAIQGTEYHEAFHAVMDMYLTPARREKLLAEAAKKTNTNDEVANNEYLAEEFREYMLTKGLSNREKSTIRRFFSELLELITGLMNGQLAATRMFQQMNAGKFNTAPTATTAKFATRFKLLMADIAEYDVPVQQEIAQSLKTNAFNVLRALQRGQGGAKFQQEFARIKEIAAMDNRSFREVAGPGVTKNEVITRKLLELALRGPMQSQAQTILSQTEDKAEMQERFHGLFVKNREEVLDYFAARPEMQKFVADLMSQEATAGTETEVQYSETFEKMNPKDSLSQNVKSLIETTPMISLELFKNSAEMRSLMAAAQIHLQEGQPEKAQEAISRITGLVSQSATKTYFGLPQMMSVDRVFPYMSGRIAHLSTPAEMMDALYDMGTVYPEFALLAMRLQKEDTAIQAQFFAAMRRGSTAELVHKRGELQMNDVFEGALFAQNRGTLEVAIRDFAQMRGENAGDMAAAVAAAASRESRKVREMSDDQFITIASNVLGAIGFNTIDPQAMERVLEMSANDMQFREQLLLNVSAVAGAYASYVKADEAQQEAAGKKLSQMFRPLIAKFAPYDMGAVGTTFTNVEGSRIYGKQVPSFITEFFDQFEVNGRSPQQIERDLRNTLFRDARLFSTNYGKLLFPRGKDGSLNMKALHAMRTFRLGGIDGMGGVTYTNMTEQQWFAMSLDALRNKTYINNFGIHFLPITTPSDASNTYMVPAVVYNTSTPQGETQAKLHLRDTITAEFQELKARPGRFSIAKVDEFMRGKLVRSGSEAFYQLTDASISEEVLTEAVEIAYAALKAEAKASLRLAPFREAMDAVLTEDASAEERQALAEKWAFASYFSNFSTGVALAGTANEFKRRAGANTVDMQKRHKHIISPGVSNAGVTGRQTFRSVTMVESVLDLTKLADYLPAAYKSVDVADAQSYVSIEFYEDILTEHGDMTPEIADAIAKAKRGEKLDAAEVKLLRPYKPFYYARVFNENTGMFESQQIKNSIIPVIQGISPEFDKFNAWMKTNNIDQVQMNSAHKVGQTRKQVELRDENGNFSGTKVNEADVYTLPMNGYRKQVNVTDHWHSDSTNKLASQLEKIVVAAARRNGQDTMVSEFLDTLDAIYKEQMQKVVDQFTTDGHVDVNKLSDWMISELDDGSTPQATIDLIRKGMLTAPTVIGAVRSRIFSKMERDVNTIRVAGGTQVQIASQFFRNNANRLRGMRVEDGKVMPAEIAVSRDFLPKEYRNMTIAEIKATAPEVLKSITLRIPSEAMNSGAVVEVVEFLPEGMDGVIVPDEFVTQMGSDFDVDKLFFQFKAGDNSKQDKLFDLMVEVFETPAMLEQIMAPQGFDTFATAAKKKQLRGQQQETFIQDNPYSGMTHAWLRADNMAGVNLKGQAANKNVILLDMIRYGWQHEADFKVNGETAKFDGTKVSDRLVSLHAEAVAAAMDGAKDPVYGKLGINNANFAFFSELLLMTNGDMDAAIDIIQSEPAQMIANGHIRLSRNGKNLLTASALTPQGLDYLVKLNPVMGDMRNMEVMDVDMLRQVKNMPIPTNKNLFSKKPTDLKGELFQLAGIGTWQTQVHPGIQYVSDLMRSDKVNVGKGIEKQLMRTTPEDNYGKLNMANGESVPVQDTAAIPVKSEMERMFKYTAKLLEEAGDAYLTLKSERKMSKAGQGMTMAQFDMYKADSAAAIYAMQSEYTAMGERKTRTPEALPEDKGLWSLEMWIRAMRANEEMMSNPDIALVLSKLIVNNNPYNVRGTYFDNINVVGINDEGELRQVTEAMDRLDGSNDIDVLDFIEAMQAYEAQRSRYGMSQSRLTRLLPTSVQMKIAEAAGAAGVLDTARDTAAFEFIGMDAHRPNLPFLKGTNAEAMQLAEQLGKAQVYRAESGDVIIPVFEDEKGNLGFVAMPSPNAGEKFAGKPIDVAAQIEQKYSDMMGHEEEGYEGEDSVAFSKLNYRPDMNTEAKIAHLKARFASVGIKVNILFDSNLPANGAVKIDKATATITLHPDKLQGDTVAHEFGHILVEALGYENALVQQAIKELEGTELYEQVKKAYPELSKRDLDMEVLVTAIGRKGTELFEDSKQTTKFRGILNRILRAIGKLFGITPKAVDQLAQELMFGDGHLSLDEKLTQYAEQRRKGDARDTINKAKETLTNRLDYLTQRRGTSEQAQQAIADARKTITLVTKRGLAGGMNALADSVSDLRAAGEVVVHDVLTAAPGMSNSAKLTSQQALLLSRAHDMIHQIDTFLDILDGMKPLEGAPENETQEAFQRAQEQFDQLNELRTELLAATQGAVSNKLVAQSSNEALVEAMGDGLIFELFENPKLRHLMTDVSGVEAGALGVKEFRNPVVQNIVKLMQDTIEAARQEGKQDAAKIDQILREFDGDIANLIDVESGRFKGEYEAAYYVEREKVKKKAIEQGKMWMLEQWDANNSVTEFGKEYTENVLVKLNNWKELKDRVETAGKKATTSDRNQLRKLTKEILPTLQKYHEVKVSSAFDAAYEKAKAITAEAEAMENVDPQSMEENERRAYYRKLYAQQNFEQNNLVVDGVPYAGEYSTLEVKDEFKNPDYTGTAKPQEKWRSADYAKLSEKERQVIKDLQEVMSGAVGNHGAQFVETGSIPFYESTASKNWMEDLKDRGKNVTGAVKELTEDGEYRNPIVKGGNGRIFQRNARAFKKGSPEQIAALVQQGNLSQHLQEFVKDARKEAALLDLEAMAYLTRDFFNESRIIDGEHTFKVGKKTEDASRLAAGSNVAEALDQWYEGVLGENWEDSSKMDSFARVWQSYTSLMGVGLNPSAWFNNVAYGSLQRRMENLGGEYYSKENSRDAHKRLREHFGAIASDVWTGNRSHTSLESALIHTYDIADDQRELPFTMKEGFVDKHMSKAFVGQTLGEIMMQNQLFFAMMLNTEVQLADGTMTNLMDAHELNDGVLSLPEGAMVADHTGKMVELNTDFMARYRNKVKSINHHVHGAYNKMDSGTWQRHWLGRLGMQFRRWLPMGVKKRFGAEMYNESRYRKEVGDYRALWNVLGILDKDINTFKRLMSAIRGVKGTEGLDPVYNRNAHRALREIGIGIAIFAMTAAIYAMAGIDDEDEMNWAGAFAMNRAERLQGEMWTYTPYGIIEMFNQVKKDPIAALSKAEDLAATLKWMGNDAWNGVTGEGLERYTTGDHKGDSKLLRAVTGMIPGMSQWRRNVTDLDANHRAYSMNLALFKDLGIV